MLSALRTVCDLPPAWSMRPLRNEETCRSPWR